MVGICIKALSGSQIQLMMIFIQVFTEIRCMKLVIPLQ
jgi:hypothetical protein